MIGLLRIDVTLNRRDISIGAVADEYALASGAFCVCHAGAHATQESGAEPGLQLRIAGVGVSSVTLEWQSTFD